MIDETANAAIVMILYMAFSPFTCDVVFVLPENELQISEGLIFPIVRNTRPTPDYAPASSRCRASA